jgi:hypothetical protein
MELKITGGSGFFSNMTIRLIELVDFMSKYNEFPTSIDSSNQFDYYKDNLYSGKYNENIADLYLSKNKKNIDFKIPQIRDCMAIQFADYNSIDFDNLNPIIKKYFNPSKLVLTKVNKLKKEYNLNDYIGVFYRGNDKQTETKIAPYDLFINKCKEFENLNIPFLLQTDECFFASEFKKNFKNTIIFDESICIDNKSKSVSHIVPFGQRFNFGLFYYAATILQGQSKYLITHSGNSALWAVLYRRNAKNVYQFYDDKFYI